MAELRCAHCGATFRRPLRSRRPPRVAFCSRRCARLHREAARAPRDPAPAHSAHWWAAARAYVRARDGFRCVLCGASERELGRPFHVDHVWPRRLFPRAIDCYRLFGDRAFVTLCPSCHARKTSLAEAAWLRGDALPLLRHVSSLPEPPPPAGPGAGGAPGPGAA